MVKTHIFGTPKTEGLETIEITIEKEPHFTTITSYTWGQTNICIYNMSVDDIQKMIDDLESIKTKIIDARKLAETKDNR
jgi:hypothetical protein